ncbi:dedicator of cytokinesis protein 7-like isoform X1 [Lytechinus pictus]|uniref:dedicator of cytokinesis protein 7-like isoform X1 n=1 Tax=Lytechinus pictus TaxID=7653 RepID=UPI0030B9D3ED
MASQRAFAQKLNKSQHAADIRRQVSSHYSSKDVARFAGGLGPGGIPLSEILDPLDYEEYIQQSKGAMELDPLKQLLEYPEDDVRVMAISREMRTTRQPHPGPEAENVSLQVRDCLKWYTCDWSVVDRKYKENAMSHQGNIMKLRQRSLAISSDKVYEVDEEENEECTTPTNERKRTSIHLDTTPRGSWASSIFDLDQSECDALLPRLLDHIPIEQQDAMNEEVRNRNLENDIFSFYPPPDENDAIERKTLPPIPSEHFGYRLLIKCLQLKLEPDFEPIFATMALYDAREKKKISENFYFDMMPDHIKSMVKGKLGFPDVSSQARGAIFSLTYPSNDVYIVIKLEKILQQGDISECAEPYIKDSDNPKHMEKIKSTAAYFCEKLGVYRMPLAWTAIHLMNIINGASSLDRNSDAELDKKSNSLEIGRKKSTVGEPGQYGSLPRRGETSSSSLKRNGSERRSFYKVEDDISNLETFHPVTITVSSFFKQEGDKLSDVDLYKFLADLKRPTTVLKRLKCIRGSLKLDISPVTDHPAYCLTPDLYQVKPFPDNRTRPTKEIQEFPAREVYVPHSVYRNILYLYPRSLNFSNRGGSARNITVKIQFLAGDDFGSGIECIYGKSSSPEYGRQAYTSVCYHNKSPDFYEEIKIRLPADLRDQHHILFTFYHISCQRKQDVTPVETPIGYSWLPLLRDGRLQTGDYNLPVSLEKPPSNYFMLSPDKKASSNDQVQLPGMKWVDGHKQLFGVTLKAVSSVHPQDEYVDRFLHLCHAVEQGSIPRSIGDQNMELELINSTVNLGQSVAEPLVKFLHILLDKLILMMVNAPIINGHIVNMGQVCFETIAEIVDRLHVLLDNRLDNHGRNTLLASFVHYVFRPPDAEGATSTVAGTGGKGFSPPTPTQSMNFSNYGTVARSNSLNFKHRTTLRNSSTSLSIPASPDDDMDAILHNRFGSERQGSARSPNRSGTGMGNVPVIGLGGRVPPRKLVHEELTLQFVVSNGKAKEKAFSHAWFFFELIVKSMAQHLADCERLDSYRRMRFTESFCNDINSVVTMVTSEIIARFNKDVRPMQLLNASLAFFLQELLTLMDRGFALGLIHNYVKQVSGKITALSDPTTLALLKLDFLRIICSHEHYVTLNLPFQQSSSLSLSRPPSPTPSITSTNSIGSFISIQTTLTQLGDPNKMAELSYDYRQQHYLAALLLLDLANVLTTHNSNLHRQAIDTVSNLLACHDADQRFSMRECRMRVASLYLPLLGIIIDALPQLNCAAVDPKARPSASFGDMDDVDVPLNQSVAMAIAGTSIFTGGGAGAERVDSAQNQQRPPQGKTSLSEESTRDLLMCFTWVIKNVDPMTLQQIWASQRVTRVNKMLDIMFYCIYCFEYKGRNAIIRRMNRMSFKKSDVKQRLEEAILGTASARSDMMQRHTRQGSSGERGFSPALGQAERLRWRKDLTHFRQNAEIPERPKAELEVEARLEALLANEVSFVVLDAMELLVQTVSQTDHLQGCLTGVMTVLLHALACNQSTIVMESILATQRSLVFKYPELLFEEQTEQCADLCLRLLHHCSSCIGSVRSHASASLYLLMRQNFEIGNNFARVKMQVTMSLSSLVGTETNFNEEYLRRSLKTIMTYAGDDTELQQTTFPEQVRELVFNLHMILSDTVKMKEFKQDNEMLVDLMNRIAKGYQNSPDLRLTWLQNMAGKLHEQGKLTEAAECLIHSAALVAEYLHMLEDRPHLPVGCVKFEKISPNVLEESAVSDDVVSPDEEGICTGKYFTESGLVGLLEHAATLFNEAGLFEVVNEVYKILIPIHEANREHKRLSIVHGKLQEAFNKISVLGPKRLFGTYFRVGFYGPKFGDLNGEEFVYKEPAITKLPEIAQRLEKFYSDRFGEGTVNTIKDSNTVDQSKLDPLQAYIQVTYVEPYFDYYEILQRPTLFSRNYNLKRFMFATPFTKEGRAHGELKDQCKRKTILTTQHTFPYIKTRVGIIQKEEIVLSPVEVAIEDIQKKTKELEVATLQEPPDPKMLQMVLQGCIGTTVNQGPMEVAQIFLDADKPLDKHHNTLRLCLKDLQKKCGDALRKNKGLIVHDQREYQRELERNYHRFTDRLMPLISKRNHHLTGTIRRSGGRREGIRVPKSASSNSIRNSETL